MYRKTTLDNGLRVVTHQMPGMQSVGLGIWIKVGGRYESGVNSGISHYLEHLVFKGTNKYSCRQIKESIEGVGGALNGFTAEEQTCYLVKLPGRHLDLALDVLSSMVKSPILSADDITRERTVILEEIKMHKDVPQNYVYDLLDELLWPGHPLGVSITGSFESVSSIGKKELSEFKEEYYTPANIVISAAGLLEHDTFLNKIKKIFDSLEDKKSKGFIKARIMQSEPGIKFFHKETEQTHLAMGFRGFNRGHSLKYALGLLHVILGANMSSRLFNEVREKRGLAYEIGTQVKLLQDTGSFIVHAGIDNQKTDKAIELILKELGKIKENIVTESEFRRAKEFYLGQVMLALEDTMDHMLWIGESTISLNKTYTLDDVIEEVNKITRQDIRNVAGSIFKEENLNLALIGPLQSGQDTISRLLKK